MNLSINKVYVKDSDEYAKLKLQVWKTCYKDILPDTYLNNISIQKKGDKYRKDMQDSNSSTEYFFIDLYCNHIGVLRLNYYKDLMQEKGMCIMDLYLLQQYQSKGYGGVIWGFIKKQAIIHNCRFITAWILEKNQVAKALVQKIGFNQSTHIKIHEETKAYLVEYNYDLYPDDI